MKYQRSIAILFSAGLVFMVFACGRGDQDIKVNRSAAPEIKNVLFIILDALRADHLGCYGYQRNTSPNIDRLAEKGLIFERAIVPAGWTRPSIPSYFTSTYPSIHRVLKPEDVLPENLATMAEIFQENGFFTGGLYYNIYLRPCFGFNRGFDYYRYTTDSEIMELAWFALTRDYLEPSRLLGEGGEGIVRFRELLADFNLVSDGGFEVSGGSWAGAERLRVGETVHSGEFSLRVDESVYPAKGILPLKQRVSLKPGADYLFGAFVRTRGLRGRVKVKVYDPLWKKYFVTESIEGDNDWKLLSGVFRSRATGEERPMVEVDLRPGLINNYNGGEFWIDDVFIIPMEKLPELALPRKKFLYLHLLDPHYAYTPPPEYLDCFRGVGEATLTDLYDAEIKALDVRLGLFFESLACAGILDETLVIITSDHGEAFGRHDVWRHGSGYFWEGVARVPLIVYCPKLFPEPARVKDTVQAGVNLLPSLVDLLGLAVPPGVEFQGTSYFKDEARGPRYAFFYEGPFVRMVTGDGWKYVTSTCHGFFRETAVRGEPAGNGAVRISVESPGGESSGNFADLEDLRSSGLMKDADTGLREALEAVFTASRDKKEFLFNLKDDPGEDKNLAGQSPETVHRFREVIRNRLAADRAFQERAGVLSGRKAELSESMKGKLRALGYL
jgi:arylsulfatase A-like enzyme